MSLNSFYYFVLEPNSLFFIDLKETKLFLLALSMEKYDGKKIMCPYYNKSRYKEGKFWKKFCNAKKAEETRPNTNKL